MTGKIKKDTNISRLHDLVVFQKIRDSKIKSYKTGTNLKQTEVIFDCLGQMIFYSPSRFTK